MRLKTMASRLYLNSSSFLSPKFWQIRSKDWARYLYIGLCLLCKVSLIVSDEKVLEIPSIQSQSGDKQLEVQDLPNGTTTGKPAVNTSRCDNVTLNKCMAQIPPLPDMGIPSTPQGVENACKKFNAGTSCVFSWASNCLKKDAVDKLKSSILGAHEMFTFLCRDAAFRADFLIHSACYKRISRHWDACADNFIRAVKSINNHESKELCCVRIAFLQCLMDVTHRLCTANAAKFIQLTGETLIRSTLRGHAPKQCSSMSHKDCPMLHQSSTSPLIFSKYQLTFAHISSWLVLVAFRAITLMV